MNCPKCSERSRVVDSASAGDVTYREYRCPNCKTSFVTSEMIDSIKYKYEIGRLRRQARQRNEICKSEEAEI